MPEIHYTRFTVTCWQQIVVMAFGKRLDTNRHNGLSPAPTCHRLVLGTCCGETDVMDFGLKVFHNMDVRTLERSVDEIID